MAHQWDSYYHNHPPLTPDPSTFRRTQESERGPSGHIENFIGHHDFSSTEPSGDSTATNFNTDCFSNTSAENSRSDCVYQRYYKDTQWQGDERQMERDYLPHSEISDFTTDGLSATVTFPTSFAADIQGLNQDSGMIATSFLENYSDVSSCSDADVSESRPSCKFAVSSVPKPKIGVAAKHSSAEWNLPHPGNMNFPTESPWPHMSETTFTLQTPSNVHTGEHGCQTAHDKVSSPCKTIKCHDGGDQPSATAEVMTTSVGEKVNDNAPGEIQQQMDETEKNQGESSNIQMSSSENLVDGKEQYPDVCKEEQISLTSPKSVTPFEDEQVIKDRPELSLDPKGMMEDALDKSEMLKEEGEKRVSGNDTFDEQMSSISSSTNGKDGNMETNCQETEIKSSIFQSSHPLADVVCDSKDVTSEVGEGSSTLENNPEACLEFTERLSPKTMLEDNDRSCSLSPVVDDHSSHASDKDETNMDSHSESCLKPSSPNNGKNPSQDQDNEWTSQVESDQNGSGVPCESLSVDTDNKSLQGVCDNLDSSRDRDAETQAETYPSPEKEKTSASEINTDSSAIQPHSPDQTLEALEMESCNGDVSENSRGSFQGLDQSTEGPSVLDTLYGEPLSREESSCDTETKLGMNPNEDSSLERPDGNRLNHSEDQALQLKSSTEMQKLLQPVVVLKTSESVNRKVDSFCCANCQQTTSNVDQLIEHQHCFHLAHNFQFCETCNLYLLNYEEAKNHVCGETKGTGAAESSQISLPKKKRTGKHKCVRCQLRFRKLYQYIAHMRNHTGKTPFQCDGCGLYFSNPPSLRRHKFVRGRCKMSELPAENSETVIGKTESLPPKIFAQNELSAKLLQCHVKLIDICKTDLLGKIISPSQRAKKHFSNKQEEKKKSVLSSQCTSTKSSNKKQTKNETGDKFKCPLCPRLFNYSYNRNRHLRLCVKYSVYGGKGKTNGKFPCPLCHATFTLSANRKRHINSFCLSQYLRSIGKGGTMSQQKLEQSKTKEAELLRQSKENKKLLTKESVQIKPATPSLTATPASTTKAIPRYACNLCPAVFFDNSGKYRHMKKHELFKLTGQVVKYRNSISSTEAKSSNTCSFCGKCFSTVESLVKHKRLHKGERPYTCLQCGKKFKKHAHLIGHKVTHQKRIQCTVCRKILPTVGELIQHRRLHPKRGKLKCPYCDMESDHPSHFLRHVRSHQRQGENTTEHEERLEVKTQQPEEEDSKEKKQRCSLCRERFTDAQELRKHCLTHLSSSNKCPFCKKRFSNRPSLLRHLVMHTGDKSFSCSHCGKQFYRDVYLELHSKKCFAAPTRHVTEDPDLEKKSSLLCSYCPRVLKNRERLMTHHTRHSENSLAQCSRCGKCYTPRKIKLHQRSCNGTLEDKAKPAAATAEPDLQRKSSCKCSFCPRVLKNRERLMTHHKSHSENSLVPCLKCGKCYVPIKIKNHQENCDGTVKDNINSSPLTAKLSKGTVQTLQNVQKTSVPSSASKMLKFKCPHCTQRFRYRSLLLRHLVTHTGLQPYPCLHCGKRFRSRIMCTQHEVFCDGAKEKAVSAIKSDAATQSPKIPDLGKKTQSPQVETDTELKCKFCTKTFMKPCSLRRHILTHNEVNPYRCKACDSCFSRYDHLKVHQSRCRVKRRRLQVCIPKISQSDVGRGWQNKLGLDSTVKQVKFECTVCLRSFPTESKLSRHNTLYHVEKKHKCLKCGSAFSHAKTLKQHRKMRRCRKVSKATSLSLLPDNNSSTMNLMEHPNEQQKSVLQRFQPYYNKKHKYKCSYCPRAFKSLCHLNMHTNLHTGEKPYPCEYCGMRFIRRDYVKRHYPKCSKKEKQSKVLCDGCGGFFLPVKLEHHKKTCTLLPTSSESTVIQRQQSTSKSPPKGFSCAYCSSRFLLFSQLQEHFINSHKMETMAPQATAAPLQHHLSNISKIKEEPVDESCSGANVICNLDTALDMEASDQFFCEECNMSFTCKNGLVSHQRVHRTEFAHNCRRCKRGFWNKKLYRDHCRKCRGPHVSESSASQQLEVPLKAKIDFALNDSVSTVTEVRQTNSPCQGDLVDDPWRNSEVNQEQSIPSKEKKPVIYQCSECDKSFSDGLMLISHLEDHGRQEQERKRNACSKCGKSFASPGNLQKHMKVHQGNGKAYSCPDCSVTLDTLSELEDHRSCHDQNRPYPCKLCGQRFWTRLSLCNHYREAHPSDVYTCRFCNKTYASKKSLSRHYKAWHSTEQQGQGKKMPDKSRNDKQSSGQQSSAESNGEEDHSSGDSDSDSAPYFPCHVCGKTFRTSEILEDHQRCHLGEKPHECEECGRCFFQAAQLQQHQRMHKSEFQCQLCGRGFVSFFALRKHKQSHGKSRPYPCPKCHFSFTGLSQLEEHMSTHREESFPCDICNRVFPSKSSRVEHRKSHSLNEPLPSSVPKKEKEKTVSPELKYRCGACNERFRDPEELSEHGCIAVKERQYSCSDCDKHFLHASHLKKHRASHKMSWSSSEYPCNHCNSSFSSSQDFLSHAKTHADSAGESDHYAQGKDKDSSQGFICPVCHQCFATAIELVGHFPAHPDGTFECKICRKSLPSESKLKEHEQEHSHATSAPKFECKECGKSIFGANDFLQHKCSQKQTEDSKPSAKTSTETRHPAAGEEEEVDVTGEDVYDCIVCSRQFSSKSSLLEHQNSEHPNEKPFKCELCGKRFALRRYLRKHERRHSQIVSAQNTSQLAKDNLICIPCDIRFHTVEELSLHMKLHDVKESGEHRCDMCYRSFSHWSLLKHHQESHVGQIVYECTECEKAFAFPHLLEEHQQSHVGSSQ